MKENTKNDKVFELRGARMGGAVTVRTYTSSTDEPGVHLVFLGQPPNSLNEVEVVSWITAGDEGEALRAHAASAVKALRDAADALEVALVPVFAADDARPACKKCMHCLLETGTSPIGCALRRNVHDCNTAWLSCNKRCEMFRRRA